jgi:hypothetical protein
VELERALRAAEGFFERDLDLLLDILAVGAEARPAARAGCAARAAKQLLEEIREIGARHAAAITVAAPVEAALAGLPVALPVAAEAIVLLALVLVGQHVVGFVDLFELGFGRRVAGVDVRVILARQLAVCLLDLGVARGGLDAESLVVVLLSHRFHLPRQFDLLLELYKLDSIAVKFAERGFGVQPPQENLFPQVCERGFGGATPARKPLSLFMTPARLRYNSGAVTAIERGRL